MCKNEDGNCANSWQGVFIEGILLIISEGPSIHGLGSVIRGAKAKQGGLQSQVLLKEMAHRDRVPLPIPQHRLFMQLL